MSMRVYFQCMFGCGILHCYDVRYESGFQSTNRRSGSSNEKGVKPNAGFAAILRSIFSEQTAQGFKACFLSSAQMRKSFALVDGL